MLGWLGGNSRKIDRLLASTEVEEADVLYAGTWDNKTRRNMVDELDSRGIDVTDLRPDVIEEEGGELMVDGVHASELQDSVVLYRQASFKDGFENGLEDEKVRQMQRLEEEYGIEFVNSPRGAAICSDKEVTKDFMEYAIQDMDRGDLVEFAEDYFEKGEPVSEEWTEFLENYWDDESEELDTGFLRTPRTYNSYEEVRAELDEGDRVVKKPREGSLGKDIEFLEFGNIEELEPGFTYEEFVDHYSDSSECEEVVDSRLWVAGGELVAVDREIDSRQPEPTNISNGGEYSDEPVEAGIKEELLAYQLSESMDMDVFAVDLVRKTDENGEKELIPYEVNSTPGTKLNDYDACDEDLYEMVADTAEERLEELESSGIGTEAGSRPPVATATP